MRQKVYHIMLALAMTAISATAQTTTSEVLLETTAGNIRIALYDETPQHRDNFLKLVKMNVYDSLLFHRVIKDFMIQSGDINSKHAQPGQLLGTGDFDYTQEPEFRLPQLFHRRGVVAMAREGDDVNPCGRVLDDKKLNQIQERLDSTTQGRVKLTPEMMATYKTVGGTPHLDGQYTVFGEVTEGMDIVDCIQQQPTDKYARPLEDIRILKAIVTKDYRRP